MVLGARLETQGSGADGFFEDVKILSTSPPGRDFKPWVQSEISGSLKNLKPGKNRPLSKIYSANSRPSNTLVPI